LAGAIDAKRAAAAAAAELVRPGMKLGLGSGSTASEFVVLLGARVLAGMQVRCAASSEATAVFAAQHGIAVEELDALAPLDLTVDGADEIDRALDLIKGGGGALLREKIVAQASARMVVIADDSKLTPRLGGLALPVEVARFAPATTAKAIAATLAGQGLGTGVALRRQPDGVLFVSDGGNYICDCATGPIADAPRLAAGLAGIAGVVEHGLFLGIADGALIGRADGAVDVLGEVG
jgi:ribose 5-phosphate isomerase A